MADTYSVDGPCLLAGCLLTEAHEHSICPDCGAVGGNYYCKTCDSRPTTMTVFRLGDRFIIQPLEDDGDGMDPYEVEVVFVYDDYRFLHSIDVNRTEGRPESPDVASSWTIFPTDWYVPYWTLVRFTRQAS